MPLHPQAQALLEQLHVDGAPRLFQLSIEEARERPRARRELIGPGPDVAEVRDISIPGPGGAFGARIYEPAADPPGTVVYYHGGGWVIGSLDDFDAACRTIALRSGCRVVSIDYRLAPEHPFPAAADDAYAALGWIDGNLADGKPIVVAGDSAGGNLCAVTALRARNEQGPAIALQVLVYPVTDHDFTTSSYSEYADSGLFLGKPEMVWFWNHYAPSEEDWSSPYASPLRAGDHSGLPPAYFVIAEYDPLRDEGLAYAEKLSAAGVPVTVTRFDDQLHAFFHMVNVLESANQAVREVSEAIRDAVELGRECRSRSVSGTQGGGHG